MSHGEDRSTPLRGAVTGITSCLGYHQSLEHTHISTSLSARPEEACPLVVESVLCDFFVLFLIIYTNHQEPQTSLLSENEAGAGGTHGVCVADWLENVADIM